MILILTPLSFGVAQRNKKLRLASIIKGKKVSSFWPSGTARQFQKHNYVFSGSYRCTFAYCKPTKSKRLLKQGLRNSISCILSTQVIYDNAIDKNTSVIAYWVIENDTNYVSQTSESKMALFPTWKLPKPLPICISGRLYLFLMCRWKHWLVLLTEYWSQFWTKALAVESFDNLVLL